MKNYHAWTKQANSNDQFVSSVVKATSLKDARSKFIEQGREIEKGSLKLSKFQN